MPTYKANTTDRHRDEIVTSVTLPPASQNTNTVTHQILAGNAVMEQRPEQEQACLVRVRDFRVTTL